MKRNAQSASLSLWAGAMLFAMTNMASLPAPNRAQTSNVTRKPSGRTDVTQTDANLNASQAVQIVRVPNGGIVPDAIMDAKGILHLVYGKGMNAFYARSEDGGKTFAKPVRLNTRPDTVTVGGERGPKLAPGKNGALHIVWQGHYQKGGGVWVTRSVDGGKTFAPERNVLDRTIGIDEPTLAAEPSGRVVVLWLDGRMGEDKENPVASPIFMARSTDNGATFGPNTKLNYDFSGRACACCTLSARLSGEDLLVAFRSGYHSIRDMYFLQGSVSQNRFRVTALPPDNWKFEGCPMSGPRFALAFPPGPQGTDGPDSVLYTAWMSRDRVHWAKWTQGGLEGPPDPHLQTPFQQTGLAPDGGEGNYPTIVGNRKSGQTNDGQVLLVWTRGGQTLWALYRDEAMASPIATGTAGPSNGRPTAFVLPDGRFAVIP